MPYMVWQSLTCPLRSERLVVFPNSLSSKQRSSPVAADRALIHTMFGALSGWGVPTPGKNRAFKTITTNDGVNIAYEVFGSGKQTILLIHGMFEVVQGGLTTPSVPTASTVWHHHRLVGVSQLLGPECQGVSHHGPSVNTRCTR